jgi:hypothetical protein
VENAATQRRDIGENAAFTILCAAIAILSEVEYWRSLAMDFAQVGDFSCDVLSNRRGGWRGSAAWDDVAAR